MIKKTKEEKELILKKLEETIQEYKSDIDLKNFEETKESCIIYVNLCEGTIYKEYSEKTLLNNDIYDFIEDTFDLISNLKKHLIIKFTFPKGMTMEEKSKIIKLYKVHYAIKTRRKRKQNFRDRIAALITFLVGSAILTCSIILGVIFSDKQSIIAEVIDIFAWVFIWTSCDLLFFSTASNNIEGAKYIYLYSAKIEEYIEPNNENN